MSKNFVEVCAGAGGLSSGLIRAGFTPVLLNDNDKNCCATLQINHPDVSVICSSLEDLDIQKIKGVDLLAGGVPCQTFSQAGLRLGFQDVRGQLFLTFIDMIHEIKPKVFLIENVKGILSHNKGESLSHILQIFAERGIYSIIYKLLNASDYGVPQKRERVFIVGVRKDIKKAFIFPPKHTVAPVLKDVLLNVPPSSGATYSAKKIRLFRKIPQGGCWINLPEEEQKKYLGSSFYSEGGKRGILRRLDMNKPALTILCTPLQKQTERCHPLEERPPYCERKCARADFSGQLYLFWEYEFSI